MELIKVIEARRVLDSFADRENLGANLAYWMTKFIAKTESENVFYIKSMRKLFDVYATRDADGGLLVPTKKVSEFNTAVEALNKTDVEDPGIRFNLSELSTELKLSMKQMYPLLDFIDEEK